MNIGLYPNDSRDWGEDDWHQFLQELVNNNLVSYEQITSLVLGHLNPSQVGTSIASKKHFRRIILLVNVGLLFVLGILSSRGDASTVELALNYRQIMCFRENY